MASSQERNLEPSERDGDPSRRMERLSMQIQEAKASLKRYVQTSPLRQNQNARPGSGLAQIENSRVRDSAGVTNAEHRSASRSDHGSQQRYMGSQNHVARNSNEFGNRDRSQGPSTDVEKVEGGYTEFFSWGNDDLGQLGHGVEKTDHLKRTLNLPKSLSFEVIIASIACGSQHSSFITNEGHIFTFGSNCDGQLGIDDRNLAKSTAPLLVSSLLQQSVLGKKIACGSHHTIVLSQNDVVYSWGRNAQGQCGVSPANLNPCFFGPQRVNFDASHPVSQIECGDSCSALVTRAGQLYTFGDNSQGQLGLGNGVFRSQIVVDKPSRVQEIFDEVVMVSCGYRHCLALTRKGQLYGFGSNRRHEMGLGDASLAVENNFFAPLKLEQLEIHNIIKCAAGGFSAAITDSNQLIVWGTGQFGVFSTPQKVCMDGIYFSDIQISKQESSFALSVDIKGALYAWGPNFDGQLGHGDFNTRTLPTQVMRLKRKQIKCVSLGDRFAVAIGKDVSLADLRRKKAAKARRNQEAQAERATRADNQRFGNNQRSGEGQRQENQPLRMGAVDSRLSRQVEPINISMQQRSSISGTDPPSHRRLNSMHQRIPSAYQRENVSLRSSVHNRSSENFQHGASREHRNVNNHSHEPQPRVRESTPDGSRPLRTTLKTRLTHEGRHESAGKSGSPSQGGIYSNFALTTNLNQHNLTKETVTAIPANGNTPLRQRSQESNPDRNHTSGNIAVGGQDLSAERQSSANMSALRHGRLTMADGHVMVRDQSSNTREGNSMMKSPATAAHQMTLNRVTSNHSGAHDLGTEADASRRACSPLRRYKEFSGQATAKGSEKQSLEQEKQRSGHVERLFTLQLDEKESVIRQQQTTIQELRIQLTNEQRSMQSKIDEANDRLRQCERERNDLRTRLAAELRNFQINKEQLIEKQSSLEDEIVSQNQQHQIREQRLLQESKEKELMNEERRRQDHYYEMRQLQDQHAGEVRSLQEQHEQRVAQLEVTQRGEVVLLNEQKHEAVKELERVKEQLQSEISNLRGLYEHERSKLSQANADLSSMDQDKRQMQDTILARGQEIRDLQEEKERMSSHLKAVEIERDTIQDRMQVTVSQMNSDIHDLQKSIGLQNVRLDEARTREEDLQRQLEIERDIVQSRDRRIDDLMMEVTCHRKQIEDQNYKITEIEGAKADLNHQFENLRIECQTQQEKLKNNQQVLENQDNQIQGTRLQLERERQRADQLQIDLDSQTTSNGALRRDLAEESRRVQIREQDIKHLELSLNQLKDSMGQEFAAKSRDFEDMKRAYETSQRECQNQNMTLNARNNELDAVQQMNRELTAHANALLEKVTYQEQQIVELEEKNKKISDLMNAQLQDQAQAYKDKVLSKLSGKDKSPANAMSVSPFSASQHRNVTPDRRSLSIGSGLAAPSMPNQDASQDSSRRLADMLSRENRANEANRQYAALQAEIQKNSSFYKSPIRSTEVDLQNMNPSALARRNENPGVISVTNIGGPNISDSIPPSIFNQSAVGGAATMTGYRDNSSPLRTMSKSPGRVEATQNKSLKDREREATQVASMNHSLLGIGNTGGVGKPNFSGMAEDPPVSLYSPLRSKTPPAGQGASQSKDIIGAKDISHKVMMDELNRLRGQIADVHRQKNDIESRLQKYEAGSQL